MNASADSDGHSPSKKVCSPTASIKEQSPVKEEATVPQPQPADSLASPSLDLPSSPTSPKVVNERSCEWKFVTNQI